MENKTSTRVRFILPILLGFFVMGFCDIVGVATSYVQTDFGLNETLAGFIPSMVFIWFLLLSVPTASLMNKCGRKRMVQISNMVTIVGMIIPFINYNLITCLVGFALLGIGNTILQVSLNPLLTNVVSGKQLTSTLTAGQVVKALSSLLGPIIAAAVMNWWGSWQYIFPVYAGITIISAAWLMFTGIPKEHSEGKASSLGKTFSLLKNPVILLLFMGIVFAVGIDVGINTVTPKLLIERVGMSVDRAGLGSSVYFICRTVGAFLGAFLLAKISDVKYFRLNAILAIASIAGLFIVQTPLGILVLVGCIGFFSSCFFSIIYGAAMKAVPEKANEISGLMITGIVGGAIVPPLMGVMADAMGSQAGSLIILSVCLVYLFLCAFRLKAGNR